MPSTSSRLAVVSAVALLAAAPLAHAASEETPGALKKQVGDLTAAPAPTEPQPAAQTPAVEKKQSNAQPEPNASEKVPVTKGTVKKVVTTTPAETEVDTGGADDAGEETTAATRRTTRRSTRSTSRAAAGTGTRARTRRSRSAARRGGAGGGSSSRGSRAERAEERAAVAAERSAARERAARRRAAAASSAPAAAKEPEEDRSGLGSITHAADAVVEVIPGTIVLALAGMAALVLLLIARSYAMERRRTLALANSYEVTVEALATAIEAKDHTTGGHIERVRNLGLLLAREIVPREARDPQMAYGFLLHDIGKLAVPDAILRAPGKLSEEEWTLLRRHPEEGVRMLSHVPFLDRALDVVRYHHERWDGGGYPEGLVGRETPLWARIFAVVDALDAMTADRPYRERCSYEAALAELRRNAGTQFDPHVVAVLERLDPAVIEPLLEPVQILEREPLAELPEPEPIKPLVAA